MRVLRAIYPHRARTRTVVVVRDGSHARGVHAVVVERVIGWSRNVGQRSGARRRARLGGLLERFLDRASRDVRERGDVRTRWV